MRNKLSLYIPILAIIMSIVVPLLYYPNNKGAFSFKVLLALGILGLSMALLLMLLRYIDNKRNKGYIYLAYDFAEYHFVRKVKAALNDAGYTCFPDISALVSGAKIKDMNLEVQLDQTDAAVIFLSKESAESVYVTYVARYFRKLGKPIQLYTLGEVENIPANLKSYMVIPLPHESQQATKIVVQLVNRMFEELRIRKSIK